MKRIAAACVVLVLLLAGCSGTPSSTPSAVDTAGLRTAVETQIGHPIADWAAFQQALRHSCDLSKDAFVYTVAAAAADQGNLATLRIGVKYMCPNRTPEIDAALKR